MNDPGAFAGALALLVFFLSGWVSPINPMRPWTLLRWVTVLLLMFAGVIGLTAWIYEVPLW